MANASARSGDRKCKPSADGRKHRDRAFDVDDSTYQWFPGAQEVSTYRGLKSAEHRRLRFKHEICC
jgi:hypothetical protein